MPPETYFKNQKLAQLRAVLKEEGYKIKIMRIIPFFVVGFSILSCQQFTKDDSTSNPISGIDETEITFEELHPPDMCNNILSLLHDEEVVKKTLLDRWKVDTLKVYLPDTVKCLSDSSITLNETRIIFSWESINMEEILNEYAEVPSENMAMFVLEFSPLRNGNRFLEIYYRFNGLLIGVEVDQEGKLQLETLKFGAI